MYLKCSILRHFTPRIQQPRMPTSPAPSACRMAGLSAILAVQRSRRWEILTESTSRRRTSGSHRPNSLEQIENHSAPEGTRLAPGSAVHLRTHRKCAYLPRRSPSSIHFARTNNPSAISRIGKITSCGKRCSLPMHMRCGWAICLCWWRRLCSRLHSRGMACEIRCICSAI